MEAATEAVAVLLAVGEDDAAVVIVALSEAVCVTVGLFVTGGQLPPHVVLNEAVIFRIAVGGSATMSCTVTKK
jgi:hypothetical protein